MLYKNAHVIDADGERLVDFEVKDGVIKRVGRFDEGVDVSGALILPKLIDLNVTLKDNRLSLQNLSELAKAAKRGGVGTVVLRPDIDPALNDEIHLEFIASSKQEIDIYAALLATKGDEGLSEIATLASKAKALFARSDTNSYLLARIFEYAKMLDIPLFIHLYDEILFGVGVMNDGEVAFELGLGGRSKLEENANVARIIEFAEYYGVAVLFLGVSSARSLDLIADSSRCYAEVSIHHLIKNDTSCQGYNTYAKIDPPLREEEERRRLLVALQEGKIDILTSLHSPRSYTHKDLSFDEAAYGIDAISSFLQLSYTALVKKGIISFPKLIELTSANPAALVGLKRGFVKCGYEAHLMRFDPEFVQDGEGLYENEPIYGKIESI